MLPEQFDRAIDRIPFENEIVFEFHSSARVIVFHRDRLRIDNGLRKYTEDDGEECYFDAHGVARVLSTTRPPESNRLRPSANGKH